MDAYYQPPNILRLTNITLDDCISIDDIADTKILEHAGLNSAPVVEQPAYDKIPEVFTKFNKWPLRTNLKCWNCSFTFSTPPVFIPTYMNSIPGGVEFGVYGNMCRFGCAQRVLTDSKLGWQAQDNLFSLHAIYTGIRVSHIEPTIPCTRLQQYGGDLTNDEFWELNKSTHQLAIGSVPASSDSASDESPVLQVPQSSMWALCAEEDDDYD
jgi:hypothetical protein